MKRIVDIKPPKEEIEKKGRIEKEIILPTPKRGFKKGWIFLILVLVFLAIYFLLSLLSFAKVEIQLKTASFDFEKELTVDTQVKSLDFSKNVLPGQKVEYEKTILREFPATGRMMKEKKAEGIVRIYNNYHLSQTLVANTRLQPPSDKFLSPLEEKEKPWFLTAEKITIPPNQYRDVKVEAYSSGEKYNIGPSKFSIPGLAGTPQYTLVYGESLEPMKGGSRSEILVVSNDDLKRAQESLNENVREEGKKLIKENISESFVFLDDVSKTEILEVSFSATSGQEAEKFNLKAKIKSKGLIFLKEDLNNFVRNYIISSNPGKEIWLERLTIDSKLKNFDLESEKIFLTLSVKSKIYTKIDEVYFKKQIAHLPLQEAKIYLTQNPDIKSFKIKIFPFWVKTIPENLDKINLVISLD